MPIWKVAPFVRLVIAIITGILLKHYIEFSVAFIFITVSVILLLFFLIRISIIRHRYRMRKASGLLILSLCTLMGMWLVHHQKAMNDPQWYGHFINDTSSYIVKLIDEPQEKERSFKSSAKILKVINRDHTLNVNGNVIIYFAKDTITPLNGSVLLINKKLQPIKNSGNPGAFDYQAYASKKGIYHSVYLNYNEYTFITKGKISAFREFLHASRMAIIEKMKLHINNDNQILGIAEALLIGYKADLDKQLLQDYSTAGVVHIIAISGLHLGLIFFMLDAIFNRLPFFKKSRFIKPLIIIACLWIFSLITGGSASVLRAALMFTFVICGRTFFKDLSVYNSLACSAFFLLCYDPYFLWDAGFQLSYLAVFGIVWLQQPLYRSLYLSNKIADKVWSLSSVTIAAQLLAFPVCIYYFHQFPVLFLFTNLLIVPLSTVILFAEIFLLVVSGIPFLASFAGDTVSFLIDLMNIIVRWFISFPFALIDEIQMGLISIILMYGIVIFAGLYFLKRTRKWFIYGLSLTAILFALESYEAIVLSKQRKMIVYNISRSTAIDFINGEKFVFVGDSALRIDPMLQSFHLRPSRVLHQTKKTGHIPGLSIYDKLINFHGKNILIIDSAITFKEVPEKLYINIIIITANAKVSISNLVSAIKPAIIIFDSSNSLWKIEKWKTECELLLLRFHSVPESGAFILDIK